jgi:hypothetical protein
MSRVATPVIAPTASTTTSDPIASSLTARPAQAPITTLFTTATMPAAVSVSCQALGWSVSWCNRAAKGGSRTRVLEVLWTDPDDHTAAAAAVAGLQALAPFAWNGDLPDRRPQPMSVVVPPQKVHCGRADEARDEQVVRVPVQVSGCPDLLDPPGPHDGDSTTERHRLDLVVRGVQRGRSQPVMQP